MIDFNWEDYKVESETRLYENGKLVASSFWRHDIDNYLLLRRAGVSHAQSVHTLTNNRMGGGPRPQFFCEDEIELMSEEVRGNRETP